MLKNYLAELPMNVLKKTKITDTQVTLPTKIEPTEFRTLFSETIDQSTLTPEKAIFIASRETRPAFKTSIQLLNSKLRF